MIAAISSRLEDHQMAAGYHDFEGKTTTMTIFTVIGLFKHDPITIFHFTILILQ
jgi:hypothetical protein